MTTTDDDAPPAGFLPLTGRAECEAFAGPYYLAESDGVWSMGFRVQPRHLNKMGVCHGGIMATFADALGTAVKRGQGLRVETPTITLTVDYVAPVRPGTWVQATPQLVMQTRKLLNFHSLITADGETVARMNCIYKIAAGFGAR
jgi:uncharacterized protein (TIGR00369 family)